MGKKKGRKKGGGWDDDDVGGGGGGGGTNGNNNSNNVNDAENNKSTEKTDSTKHANNDDLSYLREEMKMILRKYLDAGKPNDWLARSLEKNLKLGKKSINHQSDAFILLRDEVEGELEQEEEEEEEVEEEDVGRSGDKGNDEDYVDNKKDGENFDMSEARRRAEARVRGIRLNDENDDEHSHENGEDTVQEEDEAEEESSKSTKQEQPNRVLLSLRPYISPLEGGGGTSVSSLNPLSFLWALIYHLLSLFVSNDSLKIVEDAYAEKYRIELDRHDDVMRNKNYLWCPNTQKWIARDATFLPPYKKTSSPEVAPPPATIRWNDNIKKWERWSKNLKTKTSRKKIQAAAAEKEQSGIVLLTKGNWIPIKTGDGWVSAPQKPEVEDKLITNADVHFYFCLDKVTVVDCTSWVTSALMTRETPRALLVVDCGKCVFQVTTNTNEGKGVQGWVLEQYGGGGGGAEDYEDDGYGEGGDGRGGDERRSSGRKKGKDNKLSRADKKAKKMSYGR